MAGRTIYLAEPPASYLSWPPLVVDSSAVCAILYLESNCEDARQRMDQRRLHAPELITYEVTNVALKKAARGAGSLALDGVERYARFPLQLHGIDAAAVARLGLRYQLTAYDAAYLWLATELKAPLATFDQRLGEAAQEHLGSLP